MKYIEVWNKKEKLSLLSKICEDIEVPSFLMLMKAGDVIYTHILVYDFDTLHNANSITLDCEIQAEELNNNL